MASAPTFHLEEFVHPGDTGHFARTYMPFEASPPLHTHSFCEIFWIEAGRGTHHINGTTVPLTKGHLVFIRARDIHGFSGSREGKMTVANTAFEESTWNHLSERYRKGMRNYLDSNSPLPQTFHLDPTQLSELGRLSRGIREGSLSLFALERLIINLLDVLGEEQNLEGSNVLPDWLSYACRQIEHDMAFQGGTQALARLAGRSPEHVARELKRLKGTTPTEIVNAARMKYCSNRLAATEEKIADIALDAGFQNLGHFYKVFTKAYGTSPRQYRLQQRRIFRS